MKSLTGIRRTLLLVLCALFVIPGTLLGVIRTRGETSTFAGDDSGTAILLLAQGAMLSQSASTTTQMAGIIPADRMTTWNPGLNAVGGIPNRTTIYRTLSPRGGLSR